MQRAVCSQLSSGWGEQSATCHILRRWFMEGGFITVRCLLTMIRYFKAKRKITNLGSDGKLEEHNYISVRSLEREFPYLSVFYSLTFWCKIHKHIPKGFYQTDTKMLTLFTMPKYVLGFVFSLFYFHILPWMKMLHTSFHTWISLSERSATTLH